MPPVREFIMQYRDHGIHRSAATHRAARTRTLYIMTPQTHDHLPRWMEWSRKYITQGHRGWDGEKGFSAGITAAMKFIDEIIQFRAALNAQTYADTWGSFGMPEEPEGMQLDPPHTIHGPRRSLSFKNNRK